MFTSQCISVAIADDHEVVRFGCERLIAQQRHLVCVGSVGDGNAIVELARRLRPNVVIMDIRMPLCDGIAATARLHKLVPETKVLAFSAYGDAMMVPAALRAGAIGYVCKSSDHVIIDAICTVARGERFVDPAIMDQVRDRMFEDEIVVPSTPLSPQQRTVLVGIAKGLTNADLANDLGLSVKTVEGYRARACEKLGLLDRSDIVQYALSSGMLVA